MGDGSWRKLGEKYFLDEIIYGNRDVTKYIKDQMENGINIDKTFKKIYDNFWAGTFIGFKDSSHMKEFNKADLHETYMTIFPNIYADVYSYINIFFLLCL